MGLSKVALETIARSIPVGIVVLEKENEKITYVNDHAIELLGFNPIGLTFKEYALNMAKAHGLDNVPYLYEQLPLIKALLQGQTTHNQEVTIQKPDKSKINLLVNATPLTDNKGEITGAFAVLEDITERKKLKCRLEAYAENLEKIVKERTQKIRKSEQSYRELYESFDEAFIASDWELNIIHWNQAAERLTKVLAKDALGKKVYEVLPEMNLVNIEPYFEALRAKKPARFMMNTVSRQTGKPSIFEISTYPSTLGIIIIVEDKTEEDQTKRLSIIGQVAGMVGHDLRNPLQTIIGEVYLAEKELKELPDSAQKNNLQESICAVAEQINYMNKVVSDLQAFVKPIEVHKQTVNLKQLIVGLLGQIDIPANVKTNMQVDDALTAGIDTQLLKRVLINLVTNAVQAMPEGGELTIKTQTNNQGQIQLIVEDTGVGIADEIKHKIFTPMFTTKSKGQGFGLAVCKRVLEAQGGTISFESQVGKGTRFTIELPLTNKNAP